MIKVYNSVNQEIYIDSEKSLIKNIWKQEFIKTEDMHNEMKTWMRYFNEHKPTYMLTDSSIGNAVAPDVQDWIINLLFPEIINKGVKKYVVLVGDEIFSQTSINQMFNRDKVKNDDNFKQKNYPKYKEEEAIDWLFS